MLGFAGRDHERGCEGVHDELYVRALYLEHGGEEALILGLDLCLPCREDVDRYKGAIGRRMDMAPRRILLNASHTHSGPSVGRWAYAGYASPDRPLFPLIGLAGCLVAARYGPGIAARMYPEGDRAQRKEHDVSSVAILEVAIAIAVLYCLVTHLTYWTHSVANTVWFRRTFVRLPLPLGGVLPVGLSVLLILFRSDIACVLLRRWPTPEVTSSVRVSMLRPWLILLGVMSVVQHLPRVVLRVLPSPLVGVQLPGAFCNPLAVRVIASLLSLAPSLVLIFGARWLAQRLPYGRVLQRSRGDAGSART